MFRKRRGSLGRFEAGLEDLAFCSRSVAAKAFLGEVLAYITDMIAGGPFHLKPGEWTDDTSMALCLAASLGNDADTTGAIYGQLAGAYYGLPGIPKPWQTKVAKTDLILHLADQLMHPRKEP